LVQEKPREEEDKEAEAEEKEKRAMLASEVRDDHRVLCSGVPREISLGWGS
jgi:hypothetical protein